MAAVDGFTSARSLLDTPAENAFAITPSDSDELPFITRFIYVGGGASGGDVALVTANRQTVTLKRVPAGTTLRIRARQVLNTNTTATDLVGLY